jgi:multidrug resistance efflux pump
MGLLKDIKARRAEKKEARKEKKEQKQELKKQKKEAKIAKQQAKANKIQAKADVKTAKAQAIKDGTWQGAGSKIGDFANNALNTVKSVFIGEDTTTPEEFQEQPQNKSKIAIIVGGAVVVLGGLIFLIVKLVK